MDDFLYNVPPFYRRGRWYTIFIESDGTTPQITLSDLAGCIMSSNTLTFPAHFHPVQICHDYNISNGGVSASDQTKLNSSGRVGMALCGAAGYDYVYIYVYGYFDN